LLVASALLTTLIVALACEHRRSAAECEALWSTAQSQLAKVVAQHTACVSTDDCERVQQPNGCLWGCETAMARSGVAAYKAEQTRLDGNECAKWHQGGCLQTTPKTVSSCASPTVECRGGRCTAVYELSK
jgi:hypothetical protein